MPAAGRAEARTPLPLRAGRAGLVVIVGTALALVVASALFKAGCLDAVHNYPRTCYSDVLELFTSREVGEHRFPYVDGRIVDGRPVDTFEYPVLTGLFIWLAGLPVTTRAGYLVSTTLLLLPLVALAVRDLVRLVGARAWVLACSPALVLYALHNWDLLALVATVCGLAAWHRDRQLLAGVVLGVGTCLKLYPAIVALVVVVGALAERRTRSAVTVAAAGAVTVLAVNLPFALVNLQGWRTFLDFQRDRQVDATSNSLWFFLQDAHRLSLEEVNRLVLLVFVAVTVVALAAGAVRGRRTGEYPVVPVAAALVAAFLLLNKTASPQFALWLLPFFALVRVRLGWLAAYLAANALVYVGVFRWLHALQQGRDFGIAKQALVTGVWTTSAVLALLVVVLLRSDDALLRRPAWHATDAGPQPTQRPDVNASVTPAMSGSDSDR